MNSIEKLLQELCPDGVEFKPLGEVITRVSQKAKDRKNLKVYAVSKEFGLIPSENFRDRELHSADTKNYTLIKKGEFAYNPARLNIGSIAWLKDKIGIVSPMYVVFKIDESKITQQFLFYFVKSPRILQKIVGLVEVGARFRFDFERWHKIQIPLPPLIIQEKIVEILDTFTALEKELEKELEKRKKQYEYYRNKLLSFEELERRAGGGAIRQNDELGGNR